MTSRSFLPDPIRLRLQRFFRRLRRSADEAADACELLAHVLWYHPPNHDDSERLGALRVAEAVLALGNAFATDAADAALVGELRYEEQGRPGFLSLLLPVFSFFFSLFSSRAPRG